ncbi:unnamed protein product [Didymodactylos carnosus]|uniref:2-hydroxyacyl-CoA lyase 2 n=2 Tax=Didymodactylos carnosus TaxID=1234261 RepID=A0A814PUJ1_9BILA|nr:unnamed protein product [Didymodactylos carnosus]CAF3875449.1 unnamed protein product [Didymodactylos carnosus]
MSPIAPDIPYASTDSIQRAARLIEVAKQPLVLLGSQSTLPPTSTTQLVEALEAMGIPCFLGGMARGLLGRDNPIQMRHCRKEALKEADVVILAGTVCDFRLGYGKILSRRSKIIIVNRNKSNLYQNSDIFWKPSLPVHGDPANFILQLRKILPSSYKCSNTWVESLREKENVKEQSNKIKSLESTEMHLNPLSVLQTLEEHLPDNAILVADGGDFVATGAYVLRPRSPRSWLDPGAFGTLGVGGGFALGAKIVRPECEVWIVYGDGSCGYSLMEYDTFLRHKTPIISIVGNDACWNQIARDQVPLLGSIVGCTLEFTDYHKVVESLGGVGFKIDRTNVDQIKSIYEQASDLNLHGQSVLINVLIGKTNFRDDNSGFAVLLVVFLCVTTHDVVDIGTDVSNDIVFIPLVADAEKE